MTATLEMERVLRRFIPTISDINREDVKRDLLGVVVDTETTGLNPEKDKIIQFSVLPFRFTANGHVTAVGQALTFLEEPGMPISSEITKITGITDDDVRGKRIDDGAVNELIANAAIVVAHNAAFDRQFAEARLPVCKAVRWGCSYRDIDWKAEGFDTAKLRVLMLVPIIRELPRMATSQSRFWLLRRRLGSSFPRKQSFTTSTKIAATTVTRTS